jgi:hypothetical protein
VAENCVRQFDDGAMQPPSDMTIPWSQTTEHLAASQFYWVAAVLAAGSTPARPHVRPVLGVWLDGAWWSTTGRTRKARALDENPRCAVTASTGAIDVVLEGAATFVTDRAALDRLAAAYQDKYGWPVAVDDGAFDAPYGAPTAGPPPYQPYRVDVEVAFALGTDEEHGPRSTRYRFT